jgi:hypothetical protein
VGEAAQADYELLREQVLEGTDLVNLAAVRFQAPGASRGGSHDHGEVAEIGQSAQSFAEHAIRSWPWRGHQRDDATMA